NERGTILMPGVFGAANWTGAAWDPETEMYYVTAIREPIAIRLQRLSRDGRDIYIGRLEFVTGPQSLSPFKPPWGSVVAIDMTTGEHRGRARVGTGERGHPAIHHLGIADRLGWSSRSFALVTKSLLARIPAWPPGPTPSPPAGGGPH